MRRSPGRLKDPVRFQPAPGIKLTISNIKIILLGVGGTYFIFYKIKYYGRTQGEARSSSYEHYEHRRPTHVSKNKRAVASVVRAGTRTRSRTTNQTNSTVENQNTYQSDQKGGSGSDRPFEQGPGTRSPRPSLRAVRTGAPSRTVEIKYTNPLKILSEKKKAAAPSKSRNSVEKKKKPTKRRKAASHLYRVCSSEML